MMGWLMASMRAAIQPSRVVLLGFRVGRAQFCSAVPRTPTPNMKMSASTHELV